VQHAHLEEPEELGAARVPGEVQPLVEMRRDPGDEAGDPDDQEHRADHCSQALDDGTFVGHEPSLGRRLLLVAIPR
jgi:hypothetical protein